MRKNTILFAIIAVIVLSFSVIALGEQDGTGPMHEEMVEAGGQGGEPVVGEGIGAKTMAQEGNFMNAEGKQMKLSKKENNKMRLEVNGVGADCDCELRQEMVQDKTKLYAGLSNGQNAEVKIMPDTASERALERLRLKNCNAEEGCNIELKEVAVGSQKRLAYNIETQRQSKVLGLFKKNMQVQAQVDAETGEVIRTNKPWWAFLASEPSEE